MEIWGNSGHGKVYFPDCPNLKFLSCASPSRNDNNLLSLLLRSVNRKLKMMRSTANTILRSVGQRSPMISTSKNVLRMTRPFQCRSASFSKVIASTMTPPEHIRPLEGTPQPRLSLGPEVNTNIEMRKPDITVEIDGEPYTFDSLFLRDACPCPKCLDPSTRQKLFNTTDLPADILPRAIRIKNNGPLEVVWDQPEDYPHVSQYDPGFLLRYSTPERRRHFRFPLPQQVYWDGEMMRENILKVDYEAFLKDDMMLHKVLVSLHLYGLAFFVNVPSENTDGTEIANLATRIGEIKQTFYGRTWDVKSVAQSKNIAYHSCNSQVYY